MVDRRGDEPRGGEGGIGGCHRPDFTIAVEMSREAAKGHRGCHRPAFTIAVEMSREAAKGGIGGCHRPDFKRMSRGLGGDARAGSLGCANVRGSELGALAD